MTRVPATRVPATWGIPASLLFLASGATALAYQVVWFKRFSHLWGNSSLAMAGVVAGFLLGLGLGARLLSGLADRSRSPLALYGLFELAIAALSLAVPGAMGLLAEWSAPLHAGLEGRPLPQALLRLVAAGLVLGPPCLLMGATLPLLVRHFTREGEGDLARATSWFYAVNTAGAALGCYLTGFHLLPVFGLRATHLGAVALNVLVALAALALGRPGSSAPPVPPDREPVPPLAAGLRTAAFATGFGALVLQMVWARQLALTLGGTTYAFTAVVLVVLVGIGLGSFLLRILARRALAAEGLFVVTPLLLVAGVLAGQAALPTVARAVGQRIAERADVLVNALLCVGASAVLELVPSVAAGLLFPLLVHLAGARPGAEGRAVGRVYAWNTAGTTVGAVLPTLVLFPWIGTGGALLLALFAYLAAPVVFLGRGLLERPLGAAALAGALLLAPWLHGRIDLYTVHLGQYLYGPRIVEALEGAEVLMHEEGSVCDVLVLHYAENVNLRVNGKVDASTYADDQVTQLGTAYLPRFLRPDAAQVLVIGYGSGASAGGSLLFPATRRLTCLEIEPAVARASEHFASINHSPEDSPRFELLIDDGRSHLVATDRTYDLILTEPSNPWMAGVANLFTLEFYREARERLAPGGLLGQWMQTYALSEAEYSLVVRTILSVFPECVVLMLSEGDTLLLASDAPIVPSPEVLDRAQAVVDRVPAIAADLERYFEQRDVRGLLMARLLMGTDDLRRWAGALGEELHTDWNMRLEFEAPRRLFERRPDEDRLSRQLLAASSAAWLELLSGQLSMVYPEPERRSGLALGYRHRAAMVAELGDRPRAARTIEAGLGAVPEDAELEADRLLYLADLAPDPAWEAAVSALMERAPKAVNRLAVQLGREGRHALTVRVLTPLVERHPTSVTLWTNLAVALDELGRRDEARSALQRALALDPGDPDARALAETLSSPR